MALVQLDFDRVLKDIGEFGRYQIIFYVLLMLMEIPGGMHHLAQVFVAGSMDHWCIDKLNANQTPGKCYVYDNATDEKTPCQNWDYDTTTAYSSTLVSEYDLVCGRTWLQALSQTMYMVGVLVGVVGFGALSDRYGRRKILVCTTFIMVTVGSACAFMPDYWSFIMVRLIVGAAAGGNMTTFFVMVMEFSAGPWRTVAGVAVQGWFGLGVMIMSGLAYFITDFRYLQLTISLLYVVFLAYYWIIPESVRWQLLEGEIEEAEKTIMKMAKMNGKPIQDLNQYRMDTEMLESEKVEHKKLSVAAVEIRKATLFDLYRTPNLRAKTLNCQFNWFVNSLVYYGISLMSTELAGNLYVNTCISGFAELLSTLVMGPVTQKFGRRCSLIMCLLVGAVVCFCAIPIPEDLALVRTALSMIGKFFISGSFAIIYVFSAELFPTVVRNVGVGSSSMCARVGGLIAPFIALLNKVWKPLPFFVFGGFALMAGLLALFLPETLNQKLPETLHDGEVFGQGQRCLQTCVSKPDHPIDDSVEVTETVIN